MLCGLDDGNDDDDDDDSDGYTNDESHLGWQMVRKDIGYSRNVTTFMSFHLLLTMRRKEER